MSKIWSAIGSLILAWVPVGALDAAVILDWTEWGSSFVDGQSEWQSYVNADGVEIRYRNDMIDNNNGTRGNRFLFGTPAVVAAGGSGGRPGGGPFQPANGTGGAADQHLSISQQAGVGNGSQHRFQFGEGLDGASITIWDIDSSLARGRSFVDQVQLTAYDSSGNAIAPNRAIVTNSNVVTQVSADTWRSIPGAQSDSNSTDGNLVAFFDAPDITELRIVFLNADLGLGIPPGFGTQSIGIYDVSETGVTLPTLIPEPGTVALGIFAGALGLLRRRRR